MNWIGNFQKMRFNTVPDQVFTAINKEIDRYSSSLFMCKAKLFIAESISFHISIEFIGEWMDTGIEGILTFVICRKLKSNVIRIYDETVIWNMNSLIYRQHV